MDVARVAETGLWRLPPPAPCRMCGPQARSTTTAGGGSGDRHMPGGGGRRPVDPANGVVTEDWGQFILRIKEDLVSASAPSPRVQMQARCVYVVPAPALTDHP